MNDLYIILSHNMTVILVLTTKLSHYLLVSGKQAHIVRPCSVANEWSVGD